MIKKFVFLWSIFLTITSSCTVGSTSTGASCPSNCRTCNDNLSCQDCCHTYYVDIQGTCTPCNDLNCNQCQPIFGLNCLVCSYGYGLPQNSSGLCATCTSQVALECQTINGCGGQNTCVDCRNSYTIHLGSCEWCQNLIKNCKDCNSTHCNKCRNKWVVNTTTYKQCVSCQVIPNCITCVQGPNCTSCSSGFFLQDNVCQPCQLPCITCVSASQCITCDLSSQLYVQSGAACIRCSQFVQTPFCQTCALATGNSNTYKCFTCVSGYYVNGGLCEACVGPCLTCSSSNICESCMGLQTYVLVNQRCRNCSSLISGCLTCLNQTTCLACQSGLLMVASVSGGNSCSTCSSLFLDCVACTANACLTCRLGSRINSLTNECQSFQCSFPCLTCRTTNRSQCITCVDGYYISSNLTYTCSICDSGCLQCVFSSLCTVCMASYYNNQGSCQPCSLAQYYNQFQEMCKGCPSHCLSCDINNCLSCQQFFHLQTVNDHTLCYDICGDGIVIENECDLIQSSLVDGCSNACTIENNFTCSKIIQGYNMSNGSVVNVNTSSCSYIGNVTIYVNKSSQILFQNTIQIVYLIEPYLKGMPLSSDPQLHLKTVFVLSANANITDYSVSVDESSGKVTCTVDYAQDLSTSDISLEINFDYLSLNSTVLQNMANVSRLVAVSSMKQNGCFGEYFSESQLSYSQLIYYLSLALAFIGMGAFLLGSFTTELVGLEQIILFQTIFVNLLFSSDKITLPMLSLKGLKYSLGFKMPLNQNLSANTNSYMLQTQDQTLIGYYLINFALYIIPLLALLFLLYKLKYSYFPIKMEIGKIMEQYFRGEMLLYLSLFNIFPLITYSKLFIKIRDDLFFWDVFVVILSVIITTYALFNYTFRPEIVGFFRSAFRSFSSNRQDSPIKQTGQEQEPRVKTNCLKSCLTKRICEQSLKEVYEKQLPNYYFVFIAYLISSSLLISLQVSNVKIIMICLQTIVLIILAAVKPYFNSFEKIRAMLTFSILIFSNFITSGGESFIFPLVLIALCCLHGLFAGFVLIHSLIAQIKRKCSDRSEVVKRMFKVEEQLKAPDNAQKQKIQKTALLELIQRYSLAEKQRMNPLFNHNSSSPNRKPNNEESQEHQLKEEVIIDEEHEHLRYQRGLSFFDVYGKQIQGELIEQNYGKL